LQLLQRAALALAAHQKPDIACRAESLRAQRDALARQFWRIVYSESWNIELRQPWK